mmetsp:Transcript_21533/g.51395  ORF Transcript_21533/g.51395 Transcript_21533/m.51395 type:complete len:778 (-) Transcript_21533:104-2437(-)|eukprot:CAMPEP_0197185722 /NCGR_PEP_ID=MMETSP1423-20130617/12524_1 /TAXON_ID=476441 /ORGANISM="Pseudo-nitzschia heimii, Strain UNC1101" /LENGTH=777 /DNA_ID=CAMNT_0042636861 /DNA_START=109 /DNA_END=2442 /DNA_ORIENTATION=+
MDKTTKVVQATTKQAQNISSIGIGLESKGSQNIERKSAQIPATQRSPELLSVQKNGASSELPELDSSKNKEGQKANDSQLPRQNTKQDPAAELVSGPKKTRQKLRKGKWTIEEEEYTSRIIQYFSTGLLTLPDGATLRSYLAEKLNCDPMRITKKFTGACCLGRRAYHLRDRPRASPAEIEMATFELFHLEQRFRLRVEHEQTGLPLPPRHELLASQPTSAAAVVPSFFTLQQGTQTVKSTNPWMQNPVIPSPAHPSLLPGFTGIIPNATVSSAKANLDLQNSSSLLLAVGQLLLQNPNERTQSANSSSQGAATAPLQMLNNLVASYALSQAISQQQANMSVLQPSRPTSYPISSSAPKISNLSSAPHTSTFNFIASDITTNAIKKSPQIPVIGSQEQLSKTTHSYPQQQQQQQQHDSINTKTSPTQISKKEEHTKKLKAAFEEQQKALRMAYEKSLQDAQEREDTFFDSGTPNHSSGLTGTKRTTDTKITVNTPKVSLETVSPAEQLQRSYEAHLASLQKADQQASSERLSSSKTPELEPTSSRVEGIKTESAKMEVGGEGTQNKTQDEEAGAILLGFLNSLRESFEDAVEAKGEREETKGRNSDSTEHVKPPNATESIATVQLESSILNTEVSLGSTTDICERRNENAVDHNHLSIHSRRQTSDSLTSLSHFQSSKRKVKPPSVTETSSSTSSQPTIEQPSSSQEDSKSDKMDHYSSEESEKEIVPSRRISKGPPRKRLKGFHEPHEFTRENLMAHSKRMDMECGQSGSASSSDG